MAESSKTITVSDNNQIDEAPVLEPPQTPALSEAPIAIEVQAVIELKSEEKKVPSPVAEKEPKPKKKRIRKREAKRIEK